jgi:hypothetical protein
VRSRTYILKGLPQALVHRRTDDVIAWSTTKQVRLLTSIELQRQHNDEPLFEGELTLEVMFFFPLPSTARSKCKARLGDGHLMPPSLFTLVHFLEAVTHGIIYDCESSIAYVSCKKTYDQEARTEFTISENLR